MKYLISTLTLLVAFGSGIHALSEVPSEGQTETTDLSAQDPSPVADAYAQNWFQTNARLAPAPSVDVSASTSADVNAREEQAGDFFIGRFRGRRRPFRRIIRRPVYIIRQRPRRRRRPFPRRRPWRNINVNGANGGTNIGGNGANGGNIRVRRDNVDPEVGADTSDSSNADALNLNTGAVTAAKREQEVDDQRRRPGNVNVNGANGGYNYGGNGANGGNISVGRGGRGGGNTNVRGANGGTNYYGNGANGGNIRVNRG